MRTQKQVQGALPQLSDWGFVSDVICCAVQENRVATLQSLSGTGSLRVAAEFIAKFLPGKTAYLSNPTWGNHKVGAPASAWNASDIACEHAKIVTTLILEPAL